MVRFISPSDTLQLRSKILRNGLPQSECIFPTDQVEGAFHLGFFVDGKIVGIASFSPISYKGKSNEPGYQLRGMATDTAFKGRGCGKELINFAKSQLKATDAKHLWCNARTSAIGFYQKMGFSLVSDEFEIAGVGPHYEMIINL